MLKMYTRILFEKQRSVDSVDIEEDWQVADRDEKEGTAQYRTLQYSLQCFFIFFLGKCTIYYSCIVMLLKKN